MRNPPSCAARISRLHPLINEPADPSRRDRGQRSRTGCRPACSEVPSCDRNPCSGVALDFGRQRVNSTHETALNTLEGRPLSVVGIRTEVRFIRGRDAFQMANTNKKANGRRCRETFNRRKVAQLAGSYHGNIHPTLAKQNPTPFLPSTFTPGRSFLLVRLDRRAGW